MLPEYQFLYYHVCVAYYFQSRAFLFPRRYLVSDSLLRLCRFVSEADLSSIPDPVIQHAKLVLLDTLGVIAAGSTSEGVERLSFRMSQCRPAEMSATCPGRPEDFDPIHAAMLNGMAGSTLEYEEGNSKARGHPAIQIVPAVMAAAESAGLSGARLIAGLICGYEVACRVSRACDLREGLHPTGTWGAIGSALGVGSLHRRSPDALVQIANIAASYTISPYVKNAFVGRNVSCTFAGMVNHVGLMANVFFDSGILADPESFEMTFSHFVSEHFNPEELTAGLGEAYAISDNYFKPYPTCRFTHPTLDALKLLLEKTSIDPEQVEEITVSSFKAAAHSLPEPPCNVDALRFSIPYLMGVMLTRGRIDMDTLKEDVLDDPQIAAIAGKVKLIFEPEYEKLRPQNNPALIRLRSKDGLVFAQEVMNCRGDPLNPLSEQELSDKFLYLAEPVVGQDCACKFVNTIRQLEREADVRPVLALLRTL